jgi:ubiquinone/menaquinone biosynthesis C-methylase UbiE
LAAIYADDAVDSYDALWSPVIRPGAEAVIERMELGDAARVLDVGAGTGALTDSLRAAAPAAAITSIDPSAGMLRYARDKRGASVAVGDAQALPIPDASVDAVLLAYMLFHLLEPLAGVREAARVTRTGGHIGSVTFASQDTGRAWQVWDETLAEFDVPPTPPHGNFAGLDSLEAMTNLFESAGLEPLHVRPKLLEHAFTADSFLTMRVTGGTGRARLDPIDPPRRESVIAEVRDRFAELTADDFLFRASVVCAVGEKR